MAKITGNGRQGRLSPSAVTAVAAGGAAAFVSCSLLLLLYLQPALAVPALILAPLLVAGAAWVVSREAFRRALKPAVLALDRLDRQDFANANMPAGDDETAELSRALERCREALAARQATARAHGVVARLMGAGVSRLARGDCTARIEVELPTPYDAFVRDFNAAVDILEAATAKSTGMQARLDMLAGEIGEAASRLGKRAERLAMRIDTDLRVIDTLGPRDPVEALALARNTMEGVAVASKRNIEAAEAFGTLAQTLLRDGADPRTSGNAEEQESDPRPRGEAAA